MANSLGAHVDGETLEKYSMGSVTAKTSVRVEEHLLICEQCRQTLTEAEAYVAAMRQAAKTLRRDGRKPGEGQVRRNTRGLNS